MVARRSIQPYRAVYGSRRALSVVYPGIEGKAIADRQLFSMLSPLQGSDRAHRPYTRWSAMARTTTLKRAALQE